MVSEKLADKIHGEAVIIGSNFNSAYRDDRLKNIELYEISVTPYAMREELYKEVIELQRQEIELLKKAYETAKKTISEAGALVDNLLMK